MEHQTTQPYRRRLPAARILVSTLLTPAYSIMAQEKTALSGPDYDLTRLLHQSQQLSAKITGCNSIPVIFRGFEQIESFSTQLAAKVGVNSSDTSSVGADLARINFVPVGLEASVNALSTDVAGYLQTEYEKQIISSVERVQKETNKKIDQMIKTKLANEWERRKKQIVENIASANSPSSSPVLQSPASISSGPKFDAYLSVVKRFNEARLKHSKFALARAFASELKSLDKDARSDQVVSGFDCLASIVLEDELENIFTDRNWATMYRSPAGSTARLNWNKALISGSRRYLESSFDKLVDSTIAYYPRDALLGGKPSNIDRIRAFLNIRMKRSSPGELQKLDFVDGVPVWACIFYLFRCGFLREAYQFACQFEFHLLKTEPGFIAYLKAFIETEDNYLTGTIKAQIQSDYSQRLIVGNQDPYKMAMLKILGRCDLNKKTVADIISTTQDYIWLQLWLVKDGRTNPETQSSSSAQAYNLAALQKIILDLGAAYFNPKGSNHLQYFEILLLVGLFEDAIGYLFESPHQLDAVHYALCLLYHGIINVSPNVSASELETVVSFKDPSGSATRCLNILNVIQAAGKALATADAFDAVQYYLALPLASSVSTQYNTACQNSIRDAVLASGNFSAVLGDLAADGTFRPGLLSKYAALMNLSDEKAFVQSITKSAAAKCEREDKYRDAIHLYNLAGEHDKVLQILNRKMSQIYSQAYIADVLAGLYGIGLSVYQFYSQSQIICAKLDRRNLDTCRIMLGMLEFKRFNAESHWQQALQKLDELAILPNEGDVSEVSVVAERFKALDDSITCNLSELLLQGMTCIYQLFLDAREYAATDLGRQQQIQLLRRKSRSLIIFTGMMQYRVTQEVCAKLTRMDIFMN